MSADPMTSAEIVRDMRENGSSIEDILVELRQQGFDQIDTIKALYEEEGMSLADAKELVDRSFAWRDVWAANDRLRQMAGEAMEYEADRSHEIDRP